MVCRLFSLIIIIPYELAYCDGKQGESRRQNRIKEKKNEKISMRQANGNGRHGKFRELKLGGRGKGKEGWILEIR